MEKLISILQNIREEGGRAVVLFFCLVSSYLFFSFDINADIDWEYWKEAMRDVRESVDFTASTVFPSGNYPTRGLFPFLLCSFVYFSLYLFVYSFDSFHPLIHELICFQMTERMISWSSGVMERPRQSCCSVKLSRSVSSLVFSLLFFSCSLPSFFRDLISSYQVFKDEKYKSLAWRGCDVVWERGLLRKGYGLCHGISYVRQPYNKISF